MNNHTLSKLQKHLTGKISAFLAFVLLGITATSTMAEQGNLGNPGIVPPHSSFRGHTYSEWSAEWFKWAYSLPLSGHPLNDNADCSAGQIGHDHRLGHGNLQESQLAKVDSDAKEGAGRNDDHGRQIGNVWFIDGPLSNGYPPDGRDCTIPPGTALFLTLKASSWDNEGCSADPTMIQKTNFTEAELRSKAQNALVDGYGFRKIIIDGVEVKGLPDNCVPTEPESCQSPYRVQSPVFDYTVPAFDNTLILFDGPCYNNPNNGEPYTVYGAVGDGYYVIIKPLPIGNHTIRFGKLDSTGTPIRLYNITVSEHAHEHEHGKKGFQ